MTTHRQTLTPSEETLSETRSLERAPRWDENWILIRRLWPDWSPNEDQIREVWFRSFDKPHGVTGTGVVNQSALHDAIVAVSRSRRWKEPQFIDISDAYRDESNRVRAEIERLVLRDLEMKDRLELLNDHERRLSDISRWTLERKRAAMDLVGERMPTFASKSANHATWSHFYAGCVVVADQELQQGNEE